MKGQRLKRIFGKGFSIAACVGLIIGLGIMRTPGEIAVTIQDPLSYMALWLAGGLFVFLTLVVIVELIALTPRSGGPYGLVAHAYGPFPGFVIGWIDWAVSCAAAALMALMAVGAAEYLTILVPALSPYITAGAVAITSIFALLQFGGVKLSAGIQQAASAFMGLLMAGLAVALFIGTSADAAPEVESSLESVSPQHSLTGLGLVIAAIVYTYDGWYAGSYFGEEIAADPRAVVVGSMQGTLLVIVLYLLLNLALVVSVPLSELVGHDLALAGALELLFGPGAGIVIIAAAILMLLAHQNLQYMLTSRVLYALSVDDLGSRHATVVSDRGTPTGAVAFSWLMITVLILAGKFEFLLNLTAALMMVTYLAMIVGVFRLRRSEPGRERPFCAWGFPATGIVCTVGWTALTLLVITTNPMAAWYGLGIVAMSAPVFLWLKRVRQIS